MSDRRFSIRSLMLGLAAISLGLAALRQANPLWAGLALTAALLVFAVSVLGVLFTRERRRVGWAGFAILQGMSLLTAIGPWVSDEVGPHLLSTAVFRHVHRRVTGHQVDGDARTQDRRIDVARERLQADQNREAAMRRLVRSSADPSLIAVSQRIMKTQKELDQLTGASVGPDGNPWARMFPGAADYSNFSRVGHALGSMLAGLLGAWIAVAFWEREKRLAGAPPESGA